VRHEPQSRWPDHGGPRRGTARLGPYRVSCLPLFTTRASDSTVRPSTKSSAGGSIAILGCGARRNRGANRTATSPPDQSPRGLGPGGTVRSRPNSLARGRTDPAGPRHRYLTTHWWDRVSGSSVRSRPDGAFGGAVSSGQTPAFHLARLERPAVVSTALHCSGSRATSCGQPLSTSDAGLCSTAR
jgi:hypothetical protein